MVVVSCDGRASVLADENTAQPAQPLAKYAATAVFAAIDA
jgi:hypothetical protein